MRIKRESLDQWFDNDLHVESRTIYLGDSEDNNIGPLAAERIIKAFEVFNHTPDRPVKILMNSTGGSVWDGYAIYNTIKSSPCHVTIEVVGSAMSMASIILQAADERILHPFAIIMVHDGTDSFADTHVRDIESWMTYSKKIDRPRMYNIFSARSGKPASYWEKKCANDLILTAEEAVDMGLADKIINSEEQT